MNATNRAWFLSIRKLPDPPKKRRPIPIPTPPRIRTPTPEPDYEEWLAALKAERSEWSRLCFVYDYRCLACGERKVLTRDHVLPKSQGGSNAISNLQGLCRECNWKKADRHIDYRDGRGLLERPQGAER
jgi:5-methylcytosine-specific restriction endonuclease McrA